MSERVRITVDEGVADVRLDRPDKLNALDPPMFDALIATGLALRQDPTVRSVVLSGEGRAFCAGLDFASFAALASQTGSDGGSPLLERDAETPANRAQRAAWVWTEIPVPVIAAIHGVAFGGGLQIALGADLRIVAPDVRLSVMEIRWGLIPDMTGSQQLRRLVRLDVAKELTFTGREVSGVEAVDIGLATLVASSPRDAALELARKLAACSPQALRADKRLFAEDWEGSVADGLRLEEELQRSLIGTMNQSEAVEANFEKRPPVFQDPS